MRKLFLILILFVLIAHVIQGQLSFKTDSKIACTDIKDQGMYHSAWAYTFISFLESELIRNGSKPIDLSEDFLLSTTLERYAHQYVLRQGNVQIHAKGSIMDFIRSVDQKGIMPGHAFPALEDHAAWNELIRGLSAYAHALTEHQSVSIFWPKTIKNMIAGYFEQVPKSFSHEGKQYTAHSFADSLGLRMSDIISICSFKHLPYYQKTEVELRHSNSRNVMYNVPLPDFMELVDYALLEGFSLCWEGDITEAGFSSFDGIAQYTESEKENSNLDDELKYKQFLQLKTTQDHAMHLIGIAFDQFGNKFYILKNSFGKRGPFKGFIYMSDEYFRLKTLAVTLHKQGLSKRSSENLFSLID